MVRILRKIWITRKCESSCRKNNSQSTILPYQLCSNWIYISCLLFVSNFVFEFFLRNTSESQNRCLLGHVSLYALHGSISLSFVLILVKRLSQRILTHQKLDDGLDLRRHGYNINLNARQLYTTLLIGNFVEDQKFELNIVSDCYNICHHFRIIDGSLFLVNIFTCCW